MTGHARFVVNEKCKRVGVVLDGAECEKLLDEEVADVRASDEAKPRARRRLRSTAARDRA